MGTRVFLTGACGYLGNVLLHFLANKKEIQSITGIDYSIKNSSVAFPQKVHLIKMDIRSPEIFQSMKDHDVVIHTASIVQWQAKMSAKERDDINFNGLKNLAEAALQNKVEFFIQASSIAAYDPIKVQSLENVDENFPIGDGCSSMYYLNAKSTCEKMLGRYFSNSTTKLALMRMCYIVGPCDNSVIQSFCNSAVAFPGVDPRIQFVHEMDVAEAFYHVLCNRLVGPYNVVPNDFIRLTDVYKLNNVKPITVPVWLAKTIQYFRWKFLGAITHPSWVQGTLLDFSLSNSKLKGTGWAPKFSTSESILDAIAQR